MGGIIVHKVLKRKKFVKSWRRVMCTVARVTTAAVLYNNILGIWYTRPPHRIVGPGENTSINMTNERF